VDIYNDVFVGGFSAHFECHIIRELHCRRVASPGEQDCFAALADYVAAVPRLGHGGGLLAAECEHMVSDVGGG